MLVVARDLGLMQQLEGWVVEFGLECTAVAESAGALPALKQLRPAAAVIAASIEDGEERAAAVIRSASSLRARSAQPLLLIAATGYANASEYERYRQAGFDAVLSWPLRKDSLRARLSAGGLALRDAPSLRTLEERASAEALFEHELSEDIARLKRALHFGSMADVARWAHRIKGASLMFGRTELGETAALLEGRDDGMAPPSRAELEALLQRLELLAQGDDNGGSSAFVE